MSDGKGTATVSPLAPAHLFVDGAGQNSNTGLRCSAALPRWGIGSCARVLQAEDTQSLWLAGEARKKH